MNMNNLIKKKKKMQKDMEKKQKEIYDSEYEGDSQLVSVKINGKREVLSVIIKDKEKLESDDLEILEDMIKIAFNEALRKVDSDIEKKMGVYGKQLGGLF